jgi:hypothetical protein
VHVFKKKRPPARHQGRDKNRQPIAAVSCTHHGLNTQKDGLRVTGIYEITCFAYADCSGIARRKFMRRTIYIDEQPALMNINDIATTKTG